MTETIKHVFKAIFILAAITIIAYMFPKTGKFKYEFEKGKPWRYEDVIAPFDFAIKKSDEELQADIDEALRDFAPYYRVSPGVDLQVKKEFAAQFAKQVVLLHADTSRNISVDSASHSDYALKILDKLYTNGVIELDDEHKQFTDDNTVVLLHGNVADKQKMSGLYTMESAREEVTRMLEANQFLYQGFLEPIIFSSLRHNVTFEDSTTAFFRNEIVNNTPTTRDPVMEGQVIIEKGNIVTDEQYQALISFEEEYQKRIVGTKQSHVIAFGYFLIIGIVLAILASYLMIYHSPVYNNLKQFLFILLLIVGMSSLVALLVRADLKYLYAVPFCIVPIVLRNFFNVNLALYVHMTILLITSFLIPYGVEYMFVQFVAGMVAIFGDIKYWSHFFKTCFLIFVVYCASYFGVSLIQEGNLMDADFSVYAWLTINVFLTFLAYPLIAIFEKLFGFVSQITLAELSDLNKPLLKRLSLEAPGTFQHSLQVANLAEAAAAAIGADSLLIKVGALYHDVGKMKDPIFFTENQSGRNPHDQISNEESARIIIDHVTEGVAMAKKYRLPKVLIDFIQTHHGTSRVEYFYRMEQKKFPDKKIDDSIFRYPGPKPFTKEMAILMMADSVEAASRSLQNPTKEDIDELVEKLINFQIDGRQFDDSPINFKDISTCKSVFKKTLGGIYHLRVEYPDEKKD